MKKLLCIIACVALTSCGGGSNSGSNNNPPPPVSVSLAPTALTLGASETYQFHATVSNAQNQAVTWQVNNEVGGDWTVGTISTSGLYTAPLGPPLGGAVTVRAVSVEDPTRSGTAAITLTFSTASLVGEYSMTFSQYDTTGATLGLASFTADGQGNITSGVEDLNAPNGVYPDVPIGGTYTVGPDGRGTLTITSSLGTASYHVTMISPNWVRFASSDPTVDGEGVIAWRSATTFGNASLLGNYVFSLAGEDSGGSFRTLGTFSADGNGNISSGVLDNNTGGVLSEAVTFTGTYSINSDGLGLATLSDNLGNAHQFSLHVVAANYVFLLGTDSPYPFSSGDCIQRSTVSFNNASLQGDFIFSSSGVSSLGSLEMLGKLRADGQGGLAADFDEVDEGVPATNILMAGTYAVDATGRGHATLSASGTTYTYIIYLISPDEVLLQEWSPSVVAGGSAIWQSGGPYGNASVQGAYTFSLSGYVGNDYGRMNGVLDANGGGALSGIEDLRVGSLVTHDVLVTGSYQMGTDGFAPSTVTPQGGTPNHLSVWAIAPDYLWALGVDSGQDMSGVVEQQF